MLRTFHLSTSSLFTRDLLLVIACRHATLWHGFNSLSDQAGT